MGWGLSKGARDWVSLASALHTMGDGVSMLAELQEAPLTSEPMCMIPF